MKGIIFIEDDPEQAQMYQTKFELEGVKTLIAGSIRDGLTLIQEKRPAIILLDLLLKGEDGLDLLNIIRQRTDCKDIPAIIFTNFDTLEDRERAKELGAMDFIVKSQTTPSEMAKRIKGLLKMMSNLD